MYIVHIAVILTINDENVSINEEEGLATLEVVNFFNNLFDSVNGDNRKNNEINELRCPVTEESKHHDFWISAKILLNKMRFVDKISREIVKSVPSLVNWSFTIDGFQKLWKILR